MHLIISFSMAVLTTSITGTVLFVVWYLVSVIVKKLGYLNVQYQILKISMLFWLIPISFIELMILNGPKWDYLLSARTDTLSWIFLCFFFVWIAGFVVVSARYCIDGIMLMRKFQSAFLVDGETYDIFYEICQRLNISSDDVELIFDYSVGSPCIGGLRKNYVVLPSLEYTSEQLEIIFLHELTHFRQKNHVIRHVSQLILAIHFFNPFAWILKKELKFWGEYVCDYEVIPKTKGVKFYFGIIELISQTPNVVALLSSNLFENKSELSRRYYLMERSFQGKVKKLALIMASIMFLCSTGVAQAATIAFGDAYYDVVLNTANYTEEEATIDNEVEYYLEELEPGVILEQWDESDVMMLGTVASYEWSVAPNKAKLGPAISVSAGGHISLAVVDNNYSGGTYRFGLMKNDGSFVYVNGSNTSSHTFNINATGSYQVYVQNTGSSTLNLSIAVFY